MDQIEELSALKDKEINKAKEVLAYEVTKIVHGEQKASAAQDSSRALFSNIGQADDMPSMLVTEKMLEDGFDVLQALESANFIKSNSEGRRLIQDKCVLLNNEVIEDFKFLITKGNFEDNELLLRKGKKKYFKFILK